MPATIRKNDEVVVSSGRAVPRALRAKDHMKIIWLAPEVL